MANDRIPSLGFHHVAIRVADFRREADFFMNGLGLNPYAQWTNGEKQVMLLELGNGGMI